MKLVTKTRVPAPAGWPAAAADASDWTGERYAAISRIVGLLKCFSVDYLSGLESEMRRQLKRAAGPTPRLKVVCGVDRVE